MDLTTYAVCIRFPGVEAQDINRAAQNTDVRVLRNEKFDPEKEYSTYFSDNEIEGNFQELFLLFLFSPSDYILADTEDNLAIALENIKKYKKEKASV